MASLSLSSDARRALRTAITSHADWKTKREEFGWKIESMSSVTLQECAHVLGIDVATIAAQADGGQAFVLGEEAKAAEVKAAVPAVMQAAGGSKAEVLSKVLSELLLGDSMSPERIAAIVDERIQLAFQAIPSLRIEVKGRDGELRAVDGHQHPKFKHLMLCCTARRVGEKPLNVWISGPAASGKTFAAMQVAKAMGLKFYFHSSVTATFELMGWKDASGQYHRTHFRDAFEHGGVILLDEVDGWDANATMSLNAPLENGLCAFPDAIVERHPDCVVIAAANTWGLGANSDYVGRNKLDGAFLDRFHARIHWDYDVALELAISGNDSWTRRVQGARERARAAGLKVLITPRASQAGAALIAQGMKPDDVAELTYLANLTKDQRKMVEGV